MARASGIDWDLRRNEPYLAYDQVDFRVPVYNEGDVHSPWRNGPTRLLRVEGSNLDHICSAFFEAIEPVTPA